MPHIKDLEELQALVSKGLPGYPQQVEIVGTSFGNRIQTKILLGLYINNFLLLYLCVFATGRYFLAGN